MLSRRTGPFLGLALLIALGAGGVGLAQLESGDRGIAPIDSASTLEIGGIKVDVAAKDAETARLAGWRIAQRQGFKALWAKLHNAPASAAPTLPDSTLDDIVSSIAIEEERIAPGRYIASLQILFDRSRAAGLLGAGGPVRRSAPMLLVPVMVSGGTATTVETRNPWQRAWAEYRTSNSAIDYVRISGQGIDPLLVNAGQLRRPGRAMWRNLVDFYGAADVLVATAEVRRLYPGGPSVATFTGSFGADRKPLGSFTLRAKDSADLPRMMAEGVRQMDALYTRYLNAGELNPDRSLLPPPPPPVEEVEEEAPEAPVQQTIQIAVTSPYSPVGWLRSIPGVASVQEIGAQVLVVRFNGSPGQLAGALNARGWQTSNASGVFTITGYAPPKPAAPAPAPAPAAPAPAGTPPPARPAPEPLVPVNTNTQGR
ncbi:hypothetical protein GCM10022281_25360 [Sphingomonas rosea]|uniref:Heavy-metal-associated domain-containing protein n=1 Tax=Sphingomonas rosea TaxID=335605 RepID=A0ABP7UGS7_9SPHN